jgi:hypothetical protein
MCVMRRIALRRPIPLARLPDNMIIGDPSGFDMGAVEKDPEPPAALANDIAHTGSSD